MKNLKHLKRGSVPFHKHDCDKCVYLGSEDLGSSGATDFYYCDKQEAGRIYVLCDGPSQRYSFPGRLVLDGMGSDPRLELLVMDAKIDDLPKAQRIDEYRVGFAVQDGVLCLLQSDFSSAALLEWIDHYMISDVRDQLSGAPMHGTPTALANLTRNLHESLVAYEKEHGHFYFTKAQQALVNIKRSLSKHPRGITPEDGASLRVLWEHVMESGA